MRRIVILLLAIIALYFVRHHSDPLPRIPLNQRVQVVRPGEPFEHLDPDELIVITDGDPEPLVELAVRFPDRVVHTKSGKAYFDAGARPMYVGGSSPKYSEKTAKSMATLESWKGPSG